MDPLVRPAREVVAGPFESEVRLRVQDDALTVQRSALARLLTVPSELLLPLAEVELADLDRAGGRVSLRHDGNEVRLSGSGAGTVLALLRACESTGSARTMPRHFRTLGDGILGGDGDLFVGRGGLAFAPRTDAASIQTVYHREAWTLLSVRAVGSRLSVLSEGEASFSLADPTEVVDALATELARFPRTSGDASADTVPFVPTLVRPIIWHIPGELASRAWLYAGRDGLFVMACDGRSLHSEATTVEFDERTPEDKERCAALATIDEVLHRFVPLFRHQDLHKSLEAVLSARVFDGVSNALGMAWRPVEVPWTSALVEQEDTNLALEVEGCVLAAQASIASEDGVLLMGLTTGNPFLHGTTVNVTLARSRSRVTFRAQVAGGGHLDARTSQLGVGRVGQPYLSLRPLQPGPTPLENRRDFLRVPLESDTEPDAAPRELTIRLPTGDTLPAQLVDASGQGVGLLVKEGTGLLSSQPVTLQGLDAIIRSAPGSLPGHVSHVRVTNSGLVSVGVRFDGLHTRDIDRIHADVLKLQVQKRRSSNAAEQRGLS